ncbi:MAG: hypothetical protein OK438_00475 [Thaumarchaeota archaeon]|nr:hypothetical protein [Nitrososphaerota archaeon]
MTTTIKEELAKVASYCEEVLADQSRFEKFLASDFEAIDQIIKRLDSSQGNQPITVEEARALALQVRLAMNGNQVNAQGTRILMLLVLQISLLAQQEIGMKVEVLEDIESALKKWYDQWEAAKKAWDDYTE